MILSKSTIVQMTGSLAGDGGREEASLMHWGIEGMKWYHRRFRNYDGTLTEEGKLRYYGDKTANDNSTEGLSNQELQQRIMRQNLEKQYQDLSDIEKAELQDTVMRMQLERQYRSLRKEELDRGKSTTQKIIDGMKTTATVLSTAVVIKTAWGKLRSDKSA